MLFRILLCVLSVFYPLAVYLSFQTAHTHLMLPLIFGLILLRLWLGNSRAEKIILVLVALGIALLMQTVSVEAGLKLYPVLMNLALLLLFGSSLFQNQTFIERIARLREPDLPEEGVQYTRKVTLVWSAFFAVNGSIALATVFWASDAVWALYNGLIAYGLMGLLMSGEFLVRWHVRKRQGM